DHAHQAPGLRVQLLPALPIFTLAAGKDRVDWTGSSFIALPTPNDGVIEGVVPFFLFLLPNRNEDALASLLVFQTLQFRRDKVNALRPRPAVQPLEETQVRKQPPAAEPQNIGAFASDVYVGVSTERREIHGAGRPAI